MGNTIKIVSLEKEFDEEIGNGKIKYKIVKVSGFIH